MATQREFTAEEVQKKLQQLPLEVKSLMYSDEMTLAIQKVGEKNKLHYDQMGTLELETKNVLLGFTETADYPEILAQSLSVERAQADTIAKDINDTLFVKIREAMKTGTSASATQVPTMSKPAAMNFPASTEEKSVVMPSAAKAPETPAPVVPAAPEVKPVGAMMQHIDAMLSQPTVSIAPKPADPMQNVPAVPAITLPTPDTPKNEAPKPGPIYKTDPYHEPID